MKKMNKDVINNKFEDLMSELNEGIYEKSSEIALSLLAMLAGESIILLGPPGVAKSMVARQMKKAISNGSSFEYLMSRFSTPDEIFGPVSISKLKGEDKYERITRGYLPSVDVAFLDEIWKAGPAIQNTLLTILNEKLFHNGDNDVKVPLKLLIAASNELPANDEGLEALWDRFLIRFVSTNIKDENQFYQMLLDENQEKEVSEKLKFTEEEYAECQKLISAVAVPEDVLHSITYIRKELKSVSVVENVKREIYVSDRRWKHIVRILKTSALLNGRNHVEVGDLGVLRHCLWNEPDEREAVAQIIAKAIFAEIRDKVLMLDGYLKRDLKDHEMLKAVRKGGGINDPDWNIKLHDDFYYLVSNHGTGRTYILVTDFKRLISYEQYSSTKGVKVATEGVMYQDPDNPKRTIIQAFTFPGDESKLKQIATRPVKLLRGRNKIYINGMEYNMDLLAPGERQNISDDLEHEARYNYHDEYAALMDEVMNRSNSIANSYFADEEMVAQINNYKQALYKDINHSVSLIQNLYVD